MTWDKPTETECPKCGSITVQKSADGEKYLICLNEDCGHKIPVGEEDTEKSEPVAVK